jgi:hypothetical protein
MLAPCGRQLSTELQCPQNKVLYIIGNFSRNTLVHDLHIAFKLPGNKQKSYKAVKMQMFAILNKGKPDEGNI